MKKEEEAFEETRTKILDNLDILQSSLDNCEDQGLLDLLDATHNQIFDLYENAAAADNYDLLSQVVLQAKTIEKQLETWLSDQGRSTLELEWPDV